MKGRAVELSVVLMVSLVWAGGCAGPAHGQLQEGRLMSPSNIEAYPLEHVAIRDLIERFADATNHHDWAALEGMLAKDAVWEASPPMGFRFEGLDAIRTGLASNVGKIDLLFQDVSPIAIQVHGPERASARSTLSELLRFRETGAGLYIVGTYSDQFVKESGQWRFARRSFQFRYQDDVAVPERIFDAAAPPVSGR